MDKFRKAAKDVAHQSQPVGFVGKLRGLPVFKQIFRVFDRFL